MDIVMPFRLVLPTEQEQDDIQGIYFDELVIGRVRSPSRQRLLEIAQRMRAEQLIGGVLLAGTNCRYHCENSVTTAPGS
jgi:aspartate/glutamate racemase